MESEKTCMHFVRYGMHSIYRSIDLPRQLAMWNSDGRDLGRYQDRNMDTKHLHCLKLDKFDKLPFPIVICLVKFFTMTSGEV